MANYMRDIDYYIALPKITNNHYRYMADEIKEQLIFRTPDCITDSLDERMYWVRNGLTEYPKCRVCAESLTSKGWIPSKPKAAVAAGEESKGYRTYCSRKCSALSEQKQSAAAQTSLLKYGVQHPLMSEVVQAKRKLTNLEKYGNAHPHAWSSDKFKEILKRLHGVTAVRKIPGVDKKIKGTKLIQTAVLLKEKVSEMERLFEVQLQTDISGVQPDRVIDAELDWKHSCGRVYSSNISFRGLRSCPSCSAGTSRAEVALGDWIEKNGVAVKRRDCTFGVEIDCWLPDKKIGIEFDGTYWHSARFVSSKKAMQKTEVLHQNGVQLITVQEHLWEFQRELVISRLKSVLGLNDHRIGARTLLVKELDVKEANEFLKVNHLQGGARASAALGLCSGTEVLAACTFSRPRFTRTADWELIRFATKAGVSIPGGMSKLLKYFRAAHAGSIVSYADRCWSTGNLYLKTGFEFQHFSAPSYYWVSGKHGVFSRYQTQKKKLPKLFENLMLEFEPALSEDDNMTAARFLKVFDRGTSVWFLK